MTPLSSHCPHVTSPPLINGNKEIIITLLFLWQTLYVLPSALTLSAQSHCFLLKPPRTLSEWQSRKARELMYLVLQEGDSEVEFSVQIILLRRSLGIDTHGERGWKQEWT